ncbi:Glutathione S-transferase psoE [Golovinomyces cichoracearum]|uniref:Glutathione S-transferase psoE n=1 Tax=Golovinomyces cichoracearum TaxID=62708 RepID=A0A420IZH1_9PEZI|nr:Glutathione S-transferase psoE [Golovinomyces cichoracearum]
MAFGKLYAIRGNPRTDPIIAIAKANNLDLEIIETRPGTTGPEYFKINKLGRIPTFVGSDNFVLHETIAICIYFASQNEKTTLLGKSKQDYATILKWMSFANQDLVGTCPEWLYPFLFDFPYNEKKAEESFKKTLIALKAIEEALVDKMYLAGECMTIADLFTACIMRTIFQWKLDKKWREENPNTTRWYTNVINQPLFSDSCESFPFIDEAVQYVPPKKESEPEAAPDKTEKQVEDSSRD